MTGSDETLQRVRRAIGGYVDGGEAVVVNDALLAEQLHVTLIARGAALLALEDEFSIQLPTAENAGLRTVGDLVALIEATASVAPARGRFWALPRTGIQRAESVGLIKFRIVFAHAMMLGAFFVPVTKALIVATIASFFLRVFGWEGGSHRYFAHRSYRTSRIFQFVLALIAAMGGHRGPLWWASQHRKHHRYTDVAGDPHSPKVQGVWHAYAGWAMHQDHVDTDLDLVRDWTRYPELVWLNKYHFGFPYLLMIGIYAVGEWTTLFGRAGLGISAIVWVFFIGMVLSLHAAFVVNGFIHGGQRPFFHQRPFQTKDTSTNMWLWCIPTMGASWHNNHHRHMGSARAGQLWWELDLTYLILKVFAAVGLVWDLRPVPKKVLLERAGARAMRQGWPGDDEVGAEKVS